ncbi:MAG: hypothetical protein C5S44_09740 [Candidatus Methanocomedens sp.]|nr:MAG: hypothetical protein C5S44_09740 [ANME-2 cluster archaeon]
MIIELVDKLLDRCIQLIKHSQEIRRNLLDDFVDPVFSEFESVHKNYLESFQKYRDIIKSSDNTISVARQIEEDHLFTEGQRGKLIELSNFSEEPVVGSFVTAIRSYLIGKEENIVGDYYCNLPRRGLLAIIKPRGRFPHRPAESEEEKEEKREVVLYQFDLLVKEMQSRYLRVTSEYMKLKRKLLM